MDASLKSIKVKIKRSDIIFVLFLYFTIVDSIGGFQAQTLSTSGVRQILIITKYIDLFLLAIVIFSKPVRIYGSIIVPISYYLATHLNVYDKSKFNYDFLLLGFLLLFFLCDDETKERLYDAIFKYMVFVSIVGIVCYLSYVFNLGIPYKINNYYFGDDIYVNYTLCYLITGSSKVVRLCGLFVEPGLFGTLLGLLICSSKLSFRKYTTYVLLFAGFLTFSLGFFYTIVLYFLLTNFRNIKQLSVVLLFLLIIVAVVSSLSFFNVSYNSFVDRLFTSESLNRTSLKMDVWFNNWLKSDKILFGYGIGYYDFSYTLSYKQELLTFGIIGFIFEYCFLLYDSIKKCKNDYFALIFVLLFFINIYQRPEVYTLIYLVILYGGINNLTKNKDSEK